MNAAGRIQVTFGSAHLLVDRMPQTQARALLEAAVQAGATRLDTAPLYGHGGAEALVASVVASAVASLDMAKPVPVTTKVGLEASAAPPAWRLAASRLLRRVPAVASAARGLRARLRGAAQAGADPQALGPSGRFASDAVQRSIERSLQRLGRIDRLLLHEVHPADITDALLALLHGYQRRGDVAVLGVATGNGVTAQALRRGQGLLTVAHVSADALLAPVLPGLLAEAAAGQRALHVVGHGVLGAEGRTLGRLRQLLRDDAAFSEGWRAAVHGTRFATAPGATCHVGPAGDTSARDAADNGLAQALCARAAAQGFGELLVATRRLSRVAGTVGAAASAGQPLPAAAAALLDSAFGSSAAPALADNGRAASAAAP